MINPKNLKIALMLCLGALPLACTVQVSDNDKQNPEPDANKEALETIHIDASTLGGVQASDNDAPSSEPDSHKDDQAMIHIDASTPGKPVNEKVFGHFIKGADNYGIFSIPHPDLAVLHEGDGIWNPEAQAPYPDAWKVLKSYEPGALRYPGGLSIHNHDWKKTIGSIEERGDWKFGLNEFMGMSEDLDAEVIFVVSEYTGTPQDAADLVEYLNMPAEEQYPWAMKRAEDGHPAPYNVRYFEIGNESWVDWRKTGKPQVRPAPEVGLYASEVAESMKSVDPSIMCGIPFEGENHRWSKEVLENISEAIDFVIIHTYPVKYGGRDMEGAKENSILEAMMAAGYTTGIDLKEFGDEIHEFSGRRLPIAVTEYNMGPTQQQSDLERPYRFTLAAALGAGDYLGRLLNPDLNVITAIYWNWLNGFFEAVHTYAGHPWKTLAKLDEPNYRPVHYIFQLWSEYRGDTLIPVEVSGSPELDFPGFGRMKPSIGPNGQSDERLAELNIIEGARILPVKKEGVEAAISTPEEWTIHYDNVAGSSYTNLMIQSLQAIPEAYRPSTIGLIYKISFEAKWEPVPGSSTPNLGLGLMDSRGYKASGSAIAVRGLQEALDWNHFEANYQPLYDTPGLAILARLEGGTTPASGVMHIRNLKVEPWLSQAYPARPGLSAYATLSGDGNELYLVVFNLTLDESLPATIDLKGFNAETISYSEVNADSAAAVNASDSTVGWTKRHAPLELNESGSLEHTFPPHSATGILLKKNK